MSVRYEKGTKLSLSVTYEIDIEIEAGGVYNDVDLWDLACKELLAADDMNDHVSDCKVLGETDPSADSSDTNTVSRETFDAAQDAVRLWDQLRSYYGEDENKLKDYPDLSAKQINFVCDVIAAGLEDKLRTYSGRGMFGRYCPGVVVSHPSEVPTAVRYDQDSLGRDIILYVS